jgi:hypothetical protein
MSRQREIGAKTKAAYEAGGWTVTPTGKAIPPVERALGRLSPSAAPPGFSQLPAPRRRWREERPPSELPFHAKTLAELPPGMNQAYDSIPGVGYKRNPVGDALADYRHKRAREPRVEPITSRRTLTKEQHRLLMALATPGAEAQHFTRAAATGRIKIEG